MKYYDAAVIGGGVLGCFAARSLRRWQLSTVLLEAEGDVCTGITRANSAIVYSGCDHKPGSLKAEMTVRANGGFDRLCEELEVPFVRCGSLMAAFGPAGEKVLQKKLQQGMDNGVPGMRILSRAEALEMEPMLSPEIVSALHAPSTGVVNPWQLGIAAYENALHNGCEAMLNTRVQAIRRDNGGYILETDGEAIRCRAVLNCAGMQADKIQELCFEPSVRIFTDASDFFILDKRSAMPEHILFHEAEEKGKGATVVPTVEGSLLIESPARDMAGRPRATTAAGLAGLEAAVRVLLPEIDLGKVIRSFAGVRPNPHRVVLRDGVYVPDGKSIGSFAIGHPGAGFWSLIGVKTPGLSCAEELGMHLARKVADDLDAEENPSFNPKRRAPVRVRGLDFEERRRLVSENPDYAELVCRCEGITKGEIIDTIRRGASDPDGVKRRVGAGLGRCQGGRCRIEIEKILEESEGHDRSLRA